MLIELCHCGRPLHYNSLAIRAKVDAMIQQLGPMLIVQNAAGRRFLVPRHYLALHGIMEQQLPYLGFEEILNGDAGRA